MTTQKAVLLTVGHGATDKETFSGLLRGAEVEALVDVRIGPGSRKHPHFGKDQLEEWLPQAGIDYRWEKRLGGFRKLAADSPDTALRNESFRAYAGYMRSQDFLTALSELIAESSERRTVIMCSETVWWRCHRRLIADHGVLLDGLNVQHLMPRGRTTAHKPTDGVRAAGDELVYDVVA